MVVFDISTEVVARFPEQMKHNKAVRSMEVCILVFAGVTTPMFMNLHLYKRYNTKDPLLELSFEFLVSADSKEHTSE